MHALFKKQIPEALLASTMLFWTVASIARGVPSFHVTTALDDDSGVLLVAVCWALYGAALAFVGFVMEERRGTRAYWLHRGGDERQAFFAKVAADLCGMFVALVVLIGVDALLWSFSFAGGSEVYGRYFELLIVGITGLVGHAAGSLAAQLRRPIGVRIAFCFTILLGASAWFAIWRVSIGLVQWTAPIALLSFALLLSALLYALAFRTFREGSDPDRPFAPRTRSLCAWSGVGLALPLLLLLPGALQSVSIIQVISDQPMIAFDDSRPERATLRGTDEPPPAIEGPGPIFSAMWRGNPNGKPGDQDFRMDWAGHPFELGARWRRIEFELPLLVDQRGGHLELSTWLSMRDGVLVARGVRRDFSRRPQPEGDLNRAATDLQEPFALVLERPDGKRFSKKTARLPEEHQSRRGVLYDDSDHTLWRVEIDAGAPKLVALELPDGDRATGLDARIPIEAARAHGALAQSHLNELMVVGERGIYRWTSQQFAAYEPSPNYVLRSQAEGLRRVQIEIADADALTPRVRVLDPQTQQMLFEHAYVNEHPRWTAIAQVCSLLRPPLATISAFASGDPSRHPIPVFLFSDPLLHGQRRAWLFAANLLLSALVVTALIRRRALGLRWSWIALGFVAGPLVLCATPLLEQRPSSRRQPERARGAATLLLRTT